MKNLPACIHECKQICHSGPCAAGMQIHLCLCFSFILFSLLSLFIYSLFTVLFFLSLSVGLTLYTACSKVVTAKCSCGRIKMV